VGLGLGLGLFRTCLFACMRACASWWLTYTHTRPWLVPEQDGRERTSAFGNDPTKAVTQTLADFISRNAIYNKWTEDGWFKGTMGETLCCSPRRVVPTSLHLVPLSH
jgi:hypothetical protein